MKIPVVDGKITKANLLADLGQRPLKVVQTESGVSVSLPEEAPSKIASVLCIELI